MPRYLIVIGAPDRLATACMPKARVALASFTKNNADVIFSTVDGRQMGIQVRTDKKARALVEKVNAMFDFSTSGYVGAMELGDDWASIGNVVGFRNMQH